MGTTGGDQTEEVGLGDAQLVEDTVVNLAPHTWEILKLVTLAIGVLSVAIGIATINEGGVVVLAMFAAVGCFFGILSRIMQVEQYAK
jgi:hypothetical protein